MIKNKKSALNLSINAIVILILAITMLGLGLTFMRGLFSQATSKVEAAVSTQELANPPTIDNPVTLYPNTLSLRTNEQGKTLLAFMHAEGDSRDCTLSVMDKDDLKVEPGVPAGTPLPPIYGNYMIYNMDAVTMPPDKIYTWTITIDPDNDDDIDGAGGPDAPIHLQDDCGGGIITCPHIYTAKMVCTGGASPTTYKKDLLIKITS